VFANRSRLPLAAGSEVAIGDMAGYTLLTVR
jgi:hypothetical protein